MSKYGDTSNCSVTAESEVIHEFSFFTDNVLGIVVGVVISTVTVVALLAVLIVLTRYIYSTF